MYTPRDVNDHLRSGKSSSSTDNVDINVDVDVDVNVIDDANTANCPSAGNEVAK